MCMAGGTHGHAEFHIPKRPARLPPEPPAQNMLKYLHVRNAELRGDFEDAASLGDDYLRFLDSISTVNPHFVDHRWYAERELEVEATAGQVFEKEEAEKKLGQFGPDMYERWLLRGFEQHYHAQDLMRVKYGGHVIEGRAPYIYVGPPSAVPKMQDEVLRYLWSEGCKYGMFGFKLEDQGRNCYYRFGIYLPEERPWQDLAKVRDNLTKIGDKYGMHSITAWPSGDKDMALPATNELTRVIKQYCDPNDILNPWRSYIGGE